MEAVLMGLLAFFVCYSVIVTLFLIIPIYFSKCTSCCSHKRTKTCSTNNTGMMNAMTNVRPNVYIPMPEPSSQEIPQSPRQFLSNVENNSLYTRDSVMTTCPSSNDYEYIKMTPPIQSSQESPIYENFGKALSDQSPLCSVMQARTGSRQENLYLRMDSSK